MGSLGHRRWWALALSLLACGDDAPPLAPAGSESGAADEDSSGGSPELTDEGSSGAPSRGGTEGPQQAPVAVDDFYIADATRMLMVDASAGLLGNDEAATVVSADAASVRGGGVSFEADGAFTYVAPEAFGGCDSFEYTAAGTGAQTASAQVDIFVDDPQHRPSPIAIDDAGRLPLAVGDGDRTGWAATTLSDFDGDGAPDFAVGAPQPALGDGKPGLVYLQCAEGLRTIVGMSPRSETGAVLADAGDVDGDGLTDLLVGAHKTNLGAGPMGDVVGRAFVVLGREGDTTIDLADVHGGVGGFSITGGMMADFAGASLTGLGDRDGDGRAEFAVGVPRWDTVGEDAGGVAVLWGTGAGAPVDLDSLGPSGFWIRGENPFDHAGQAMVAPGDLDGDGLLDLVIAAPHASRELSEQGRVYVMPLAQMQSFSLKIVAAGAAGFALEGNAAHQRLGSVLGATGDVDGDGVADFAIGEPGWANGRGRVVVITDASAPIELADALGGAAGFAIEGQGEGDAAGLSIAAAGDVNGDGLGDLWIGASGATSARGRTGRVYLVHGRSDGVTVDLATIATGVGGMVFDGDAPNEATGRAVAGGADFDGDGALDLVVGAPGSSADGPYAGRVRVTPAAPMRCE